MSQCLRLRTRTSLLLQTTSPTTPSSTVSTVRTSTQFTAVGSGDVTCSGASGVSLFSGNSSSDDLDKFSESFIDQEEETVTTTTTTGSTERVDVPNSASRPVSRVSNHGFIYKDK